MEKCKFCQAELEENKTICPACGKDNAALEEQESAETVTEPAAETAQEQTPEAAQEQDLTEEAVSGEQTTEAAQDQDLTEEADNTEQTPDASEKKEPTAAIVEGTKATPGKIALAVAAVVVLLAVLIGAFMAGMKQGAKQVQEEVQQPTTTQSEFAVDEPAAQDPTIPPDGDPNDVTCKGSYSASDEEVIAARDTVVATIGDRQLTIAQLQVYYQVEFQSFLSNYGMYASYFGLDYTQPLDTQKSMDESGITWQQLFLQNALKNWQQIQAMAAEGEKAGLEMSEEDAQTLNQMEQTLAELAESYEMDVDELMYSNFGPGAGVEEYRYFQEQYYKGIAYYEDATGKLKPTEEELEAYYQDHVDDYAMGGVTEDARFVDVRHILVTIKGGTTDDSGVTTYSDEEWEACRQEAQAILDAWLEGDATEDSFAALATEKTEDPGSMETGGLYEKVYEGQMVEPFNDWCFDESRVYGDYGLVQTSYGYHVMFFVNSQLQWPIYAESDWIQEQTNQLLENLVESYPIDVDYEKILLGSLSFGE